MTTTFTFAPATRETARARIALQGPGGSGKTKSALRIAEGLAKGGTIGVVDTERGTALKYAPVPGRPDIEAHEFAHLPMAVCSPENLLAAVAAAIEARIAVLIIDSWSHFWAGKGGLLARVDVESKKASHSGGKYTAWAPVNDLEQDMLDALLTYPGHVVCTMRTKNDYEMANGQVKKIGVKTVQRDGAEYEFDVVMDMVEGTGRVTKTRYSPLDDLTVHHPDAELAEVILEQLGQGVDRVQVIVDELMGEALTFPRARELYTQAQQKGLLGSGVLHPVTGTPTTLEALILERGTAVKPAEPVTATPPPAAAPEEHGPAPYSMSDAIGASGGIIDEPLPAGQFTPEQEERIDRAATAPLADVQAPPAAAAPKPATPPQMRAVHACLSDLGIDTNDRTRRLTALGLLIGRRIESANEMTFTDAGRVLDTLGKFVGDDRSDRFRAHLNELLAAVQSGNTLVTAA